MTTELIAELREVVRLSERATPGKVELHKSCSWRRIVAERGRPFLVPGIDPDKHPNMDTTESAEFVVELVNWFRTHHSAIESAARDAERYRHIKSAPAGTVRADFNAWAPAYYYWGEGKSLDEQIDAALATQHNSGREG